MIAELPLNRTKKAHKHEKCHFSGCYKPHQGYTSSAANGLRSKHAIIL